MGHRTDRVAKEGHHRDSEELAEAVLERVRTPLAVLSGSFVVVRANTSFFSVLDIPAGQAVGKSIFDAGAGHLDVPELRTLLEHVLPERTEIRDFEIRGDFGGIGRRILLLNGRPLVLGGDGRPLILLSIEDVTERQRLEQETRRYARELERSNRELEDFAHAASHDLQEPLRKIRTYADRLRGLLDPSLLDERASHYLSRLSEATERMQRRIEDLLRLARVGRTPAVFQATDLEQVMRDVLDDLEIAARESDASIEVGDLPEIEADPSQLRMLFQNLIANALKFHRPGDRPVVRIRSDPAVTPGTVRLIVEDEGIGFEQQFAERIFGPFQRLHGREEYEGSGVGLSLCRRLVEHHEGSIRAEGRPGQGARFEVILPVLQVTEEF